MFFIIAIERPCCKSMYNEVMDTLKSNLRAIKQALIAAIILGIILSVIPKDTCAQINKENNAMENKKLIQQGYDHWASGTGSFFDLLAEDVSWTITGSTPLSKTYTSKEQFMNEVIIPLDKRLAKKIVPAVTGLYADGDMVTAIWSGKATATDGKPYNGTYCWNMQVKNGEIVKVIAFLDGMEFTDIMNRISVTE
jgi:ketosteroid isomerase-like protein